MAKFDKIIFKLFGIGVGATAVLTLVTPPAANLSLYALIAVRVIEGLFEVMRAVAGKRFQVIQLLISGRDVLEFVRNVVAMGAAVRALADGCCRFYR